VSAVNALSAVLQGSDSVQAPTKPATYTRPHTPASEPVQSMLYSSSLDTAHTRSQLSPSSVEPTVVVRVLLAESARQADLFATCFTTASAFQRCIADFLSVAGNFESRSRFALLP
jgi:hypothetical protein